MFLCGSQILQSPRFSTLSNLTMFFTVRNKVAKVMFLPVSVCPWGDYLGSYPPDQVHPPGPGTSPLGPDAPPDQVHPPGPGTPPSGTRHTPDQVPPQDQVHLPRPGTPRPGTPPAPGTPPWTRSPQDQVHPPRQVPPPPRRLLLRTVCILLECIPVLQCKENSQGTRHSITGC